MVSPNKKARKRDSNGQSAEPIAVQPTEPEDVEMEDENDAALLYEDDEGWKRNSTSTRES